eukprot:scaffold20268_cov111-Isochrysis_galbana.AAC.1
MVGGGMSPCPDVEDAEVVYMYDPYCSLCEDQSDDEGGSPADAYLDRLPVDWDDCGGRADAHESDAGQPGPSGSLPPSFTSWPALSAERESSRGMKSNRGSYPRDATTGKGIRKTWVQSGLDHIDAIKFPSGSFWMSSPCSAFF